MSTNVIDQATTIDLSALRQADLFDLTATELKPEALEAVWQPLCECGACGLCCNPKSK